MLDLHGTSSVVTGGASGLGEAAARLLTKAGARVVIADLNDDRGKQVATEIGGEFVHVDVTKTDEITQAIDAAVSLGPLRTCVTAAGVGWASRTIGKDGEYSSAHDLGAFSRVLAINLVGTFDTIRLAATKMSQTDQADDSGNRGAIATLSSSDTEAGVLPVMCRSTRSRPEMRTVSTNRSDPSGRTVSRQSGKSARAPSP